MTMKNNDIKNKIENMLNLMGFSDDIINVSVDEEYNKISIGIDDDVVRGDNSPRILTAFHHIINQILRKEEKPYFVVDLNYYRKERERLITELARTAARKATVSGDEVDLPPMNSYERRIVHMELKTHPSLATESKGTGKERKVIIKKVDE